MQSSLHGRLLEAIFFSFKIKYVLLESAMHFLTLLK